MVDSYGQVQPSGSITVNPDGTFSFKVKLEAQLKAERGTGFKDVKTYDDHPAAYLALAQGSVDGVLNTVPTLSVVMRDKPGVYAVVQNVGGNNWHGYAFRKEDTEIADYMNQRIITMKGKTSACLIREAGGVSNKRQSGLCV